MAHCNSTRSLGIHIESREDTRVSLALKTGLSGSSTIKVGELSYHKTLTKLLLQNRQRCTASSNSSTTHPRANGGNQFGCSGDVRADNGRKAFRLQPIHVRTYGVDNINVVIEHRAIIQTRSEPSFPNYQNRLTPVMPICTYCLCDI